MGKKKATGRAHLVPAGARAADVDVVPAGHRAADVGAAEIATFFPMRHTRTGEISAEMWNVRGERVYE